MCDCGAEKVECLACINDICPDGCDGCVVCSFCEELYCEECTDYVCQNCGTCSICESGKLYKFSDMCQECRAGTTRVSDTGLGTSGSDGSDTES